MSVCVPLFRSPFPYFFQVTIYLSFKLRLSLLSLLHSRISSLPFEPMDYPTTNSLTNSTLCGRKTAPHKVTDSDSVSKPAATGEAALTSAGKGRRLCGAAVSWGRWGAGSGSPGSDPPQGPEAGALSPSGISGRGRAQEEGVTGAVRRQEAGRRLASQR